MNITYCEGGDMFLGNFSFAMFNVFSDETHTECTPGVDCAGDVVEVISPPCVESDDGRDYITPGMILSGVNLEDVCMSSDILRERYCNSELTYTSEDISCSAYGSDYFCLGAECVYSPDIEADDDPDDADPETNCGDGLDNDEDGLLDCADPDCSVICGDFDYSCQHISPYPTCGGTCPSGEECIIYNIGDGTLDGGGWCECMPEEETSCYESTGCDGWCGEGYLCNGDSFGCFCEFDFSGDCEDTDGGIDYLVGGFSIENNPLFGILNIIEYCGWDKGDENTLYEYYCSAGEAMPIEVDCITLGLICIEDSVDGSYCGEGEY